METISEMKILKVAENIQVRRNAAIERSSDKWVEASEMLEVLKAEGGENLFNYSEWLGVTNEQNFLVLSSNHHYYYNEEELKNVSTIITIKKLNQIKNISEFFDTIFRLLPAGSKMVGRFTEGRRIGRRQSIGNTSINGSMSASDALENGIIARNPFINMLFSFFDSRTNRHMTREYVTCLLKSHGFSILDLTELNGSTFFFAQKKAITAE